MHNTSKQKKNVANNTHDTPISRRQKQLNTHTPSWAHLLLPRLMSVLGNPPITVILPDGFMVTPPNGESVGTVKFLTTSTIYQILRRADVGFGEEYSRGNIEIEGDMIDILTASWQSITKDDKNILIRLKKLIHHMPHNTLTKAQNNVQHHYDIGNSFYKLWLDPEMQYTCAYYPRPNMSLTQAQQAKLKHICRKLQLKSGDHIIDAGCGWGGLARHIALNYDVTVSAYNISQEQITFARERAKREGFADRVEYIQDDFRNMQGTCDAFVSIGMLEHVGPPNYLAMGQLLQKILKPSGRGLIHTIGRNRPRPMSRWINKYIFPGAYPPTIKEMMNVFETGDFSILDIENLRLHYDQTLVHWTHNYEQNIDKVEQIFGNEITRAWRLYLNGSIAAFRCGALQLFQVVFAHGTDNTVPYNRYHIYPAGTDS